MPPSRKTAARTVSGVESVSETVSKVDQELGKLMDVVRLALREEMKLLGATTLPTVLTYKDAAHELSVSLSTLKSMVASGVVARCDRGIGGVGIPKAEILRLAAKWRTDPPGRRARRGKLAQTSGPAFRLQDELEKAKKLRRRTR